MDALDLILEDMPTAKVSQTSDNIADDDIMMALEEFDSAKSPKDRLEALKLLVRLSR